MLNKNLFRSEVVKAGLTFEQVAQFMGINVATLYRKLNGESDFTRNEITMFKSCLGLNMDSITAIFFTDTLA